MKKGRKMGWHEACANAAASSGARLLTLAAIPAMFMYLPQAGGDAAAASQAAAQNARPAANAQSRNRVPIDVDGWLARLKARDIKAESSGEDLFAGTTWQPPPKPEAFTPAPPPQMPAFPFQVIGLVSVGGTQSLALEKGDNAYAVREGDVIEGYRIDRIGENSFVVAHAPTRMSREYRYAELYPKPSQATAPNARRQPARPVIVPPMVVTPRAAPAEAPAAETAPAANAGANTMVPLGGVVGAPSSLINRSSRSTTYPPAVSQ